ncbi:MAG: Hint domain-containing protein [Steroidobacteraceae bacterium]
MSKTTIVGSTTTVTLTTANSPLYNTGVINPTASGYGANGVYSDTSGVSFTNNSHVYGKYGEGIKTNYGTDGGAGGIGVEFKLSGTVANYGIIKGGAGGYGIDLGGSGGVGVSLSGASSTLNDRGGEVSGAGIFGGSGGYSYGGTGGSGGAAVVLNAGAALSNYAHIQGGAGGSTYAGSGGGVGGSGGAGVSDPGGGAVSNFANINGGAISYSAKATVGGDGVDMKGGALTNAALGNNPIIQGGSVANDLSASISGGSVNTHNTAGTGNGGAGVILADSATLQNSYHVAGGAATAGAGGVGVTASGAVSPGFNITNLLSGTAYGHIAGGSSVTGTGGNAVDLGANATLYNQNNTPLLETGGITGGGSNDGNGGVGVDLLASGAAVTNAGSIYGGASAGAGTAGGVGVELSAGTNVTNSGTIEGGGGNSATTLGGVGVVLNGAQLVTSGLIDGGQNLGNAALHADSVQFGSSPSTLVVESGAKFTGDLAGFAHGDTIHITYLTPGTVQSDFNTSTDVLTLPDGNTLNFTGTPGSLFQFNADINGGTDITIACYRRGTRILTAQGEVAIERLSIGDLVTTMSGGSMPIRWIGRRSYSCAVAAGNRAVLPILIRAGALADGIPRRDLWVSPSHALFVEGALIPAQELVNGVSIIQEERVDEVTYLHLELDTHQVIVAEGAFAESYVDDESRAQFDNAADYVLRYPHAAREPARFCAPRIEEGWELEAARRRFAARASVECAFSLGAITALSMYPMPAAPALD